ncbi:helix-turn-helix transcriptional regulator [Granulicella sp. WH15]|uniref:helix-turn-helix domain-containing protein n=1 Tax=Granulicella sp. WH15 TaxID=2602070 RepID=UPI001366D89C|nr:AraC family transcriptional regulator [Granulicella sp. WH15]QHN03630.1 helix-turn-helix transcriptional regulator [Granulicella sp. WH15]
MDALINVPTVWDQLAETMYLKDLPTAEVKVSNLASCSFARLQSSCGLPGLARPVVGEHGYIVALQLKAIPFIEQFLGTKKVSSGPYPVGGVSAINLVDQPAVLLPNPFDTLLLHITQTALDEFAYAHGASRVEKLVWPHGAFDPVVHSLGQSLVCALDHPVLSSRLFLDYVLQALNCHFVCSYGKATQASLTFRGGLSPSQRRRATELLDAHLDGNIALQQVAEACDLSLGHFARAFTKTFRKPPHRWLTERRVDRAKSLMSDSLLSLADIAARCGFTDQSALSRSFKRLYGISPGTWRRSTSGRTKGL